MPSITMELAKMSHEKKARLVEEVTRATVEATGLPAETVYVFIKENEPNNIGVGGILLSDRK